MRKICFQFCWIQKLKYFLGLQDFLNTLSQQEEQVLHYFSLLCQLYLMRVIICFLRKSEFPIFPPNALINVFDIAPPIIMLSANSINFSITLILSDTFAPPRIAVKGLL